MSTSSKKSQPEAGPKFGVQGQFLGPDNKSKVTKKW